MAAVFHGSDAKGSARLVLLALADTAADTGEVSAYARSYSELGRKANVSRTATVRAIEALTALGEVEIVVQGDGRKSTDYRIDVDRLQAQALAKKAAREAEKAAKKATRSEGAQSAPPQPESAEDQVGTPGVAERTPRESRSNPLGAQDGHPIIPSSPVVPPSLPSAADAAGGATDLFGGQIPEPTAAQVSKANAHRVTTLVFEQRHPRPATPFVGVMSVARALLDAGHPSERVVDAMVEPGALTVAAVEFRLGRAAEARGDAERRRGPSLSQSTIKAAAWAARAEQADAHPTRRIG